mgnify:FL=1
MTNAKLLTFQVETLATAKHEAMPLLVMHWEEIALNKDTVPLDPDWDAYEKIESAGFYHVVTARDDGALVGYATYTIVRNLHYRSLIIAEADIFFLAPEYRQGMAGIRMLAFAEKTLTEHGVNKILTRTKIHHDLGPLLERMGFVPIERVYAKMVE